MRYLPLTQPDREAMLATIGAATIDDLFVDVPAVAQLDGPIRDLPMHASDLAVERLMTALARKNLAAGEAPFFLGCGAYRHHVPASVDHLIQRGEILTAYTPYQPEIAQGALHPHYVSVAKTMAKYTGDQLETSLPSLTAKTDIDGLIASIDGDTSCVVVQYPDILGRIADLRPLADACHAKKALLIAVVTEPVALGALRSPGEMDADIVVGEGQSIGVGLQFGGPYVGLMGCKDKYIRQMPGRFCGETMDAEGKRGFVLTLSTREQHIRREKATSNICSNSGLCALAFSIHMTLLGEAGLRALAAANHAGAVAAAERLAKVPGVELINDSFFNEFTLKLSKEARPVVRALADKGILAGVSLGRLYPDAPDLANGLVVAVTETTTQEDVETFASALEEALA